MVRLRADDVLGLRIPEHDIGVAAGSKSSLFRVHAKNLCWRRRDDLDETVQGKLTLVHPVMIEKLQAVFDSGTAVGYFGEVAFAKNLLVLVTEGAVVGRDYLQVVVFQAVPQLREILFFPQRRGKDVFGALEPGTLEFVDGEKQILRTGFREGRNAAAASFAHLIERVFRRKMDDVNGSVGDFGEGDRAIDGFGFGNGGPGERVIDRSGLAVGQSLLDNDVDDAAIF